MIKHTHAAINIIQLYCIIVTILVTLHNFSSISCSPQNFQTMEVAKGVKNY